jgi:putative hydrolase of the HAD superfamily
MADRTGRSVEEIRKAAHGNPELLNLFEVNKISPVEFYKKVKTALHVNVGYEQFYADYCDVFSLNRPVLQVLAGMRPKYKLALISNTDRMRFDFIQNHFSELFIFDGYALSFDLGLRKPEPGIFRAALQRVGSRPEDSLFIDDIQENIDAAERLGIKGLHFDRHMDLEAELRRNGVFP